MIIELEKAAEHRNLAPRKMTNLKNMYLFFLGVFFLQILCKKLLCHWTPYFSTLYVCNKSTFYQIQPVCFIQFGTNKEVQICNPLVLSHQCGYSHVANFHFQAEITKELLSTSIVIKAYIPVSPSLQ